LTVQSAESPQLCFKFPFFEPESGYKAIQLILYKLFGNFHSMKEFYDSFIGSGQTGSAAGPGTYDGDNGSFL
jgi:hypothetical protein